MSRFTWFVPTTLLFLITVVHASSPTDEGWTALLANRDAEAIPLFEQALARNPKNTQALLGLTYAYELRLDAGKAWDAFRRAVESSSNPHALLYASVLSRRFQQSLHKPESGLENMLVQVTKKPDPAGILQAMAYEMLGSVEERRGNIDAANAWYDNIGAIMNWRVIGPFPNVSASGHDRIFSPELMDEPQARYEGVNGGEVHWFAPQRWRHDRWIDFTRLSPTIEAVFYAITYVESDREQRVQLRLGTSGAYKLFLNTHLVSETFEEHNNDLDTYITDVTLHKGWNRVLVKVSNSELNRCNFLLRITTPAGKPLTNLRTSLEAHPIDTSDVRPTPVANPHVMLLKSQFDARPADAWNALLLAEAHLRNDQANDAWEVVTASLQRHPDAIVLLMQAIESYQRSQQRDQLVSTIERIVALRPDLPIALTYAFQQARDAKKLDEAEKLVQKIAATLPGSPDYYDAAIAVARDRQQLATVVELQADAFKTYPDNANFAQAAAYSVLRETGSHDQALEIVDRHLKAAYGEAGLLLRASILADAVRFAEWERCYEDLFRLSPSAPGYHFRMANTYAARNDYAAALRHVNEALTDAPVVSSLWQQAGTYHRSLKNDSAARACMQRALKLDPSNFEAREALRVMDGAPSPFTYFRSVSVDSAMKHAPTAADYPDAGAVYVLDLARRIVHDGSRSEVEYEQLIRILTTSGIDTYKEMQLPGGGSSSLTVEKAVVRKMNGTEIPADRQGGYAVFKNLEPGDFIYMKTRTREASTGRLAPYFMDEFVFNGSVPVQEARYELLVAPGHSFKWAVSNGTAEMQSRTTDFGELYDWSMTSVPAIAFEEGSPGFDDMAKILQVSSIPNWGELIRWYHDIASTKTRSAPTITRLVDSLFPRSQTFTKEEIIAGTYRYITSQIRYSNVPFRQNNVIPQKARDVLATRIGDCKDVATLCIAMLAERGIESYHVLVETDSYASSRQVLPSLPFNHAMVMVNMDGSPLYIDLTADNVPVGSVPFADIDAFCLVIHPGWQLPERMHRSLFTPNNVTVDTRVMMHQDMSATVSQTFTHTGARTQFYRSAWQEMSDTELRRSLVETLASDYPDVHLDTFLLSDVESLSPTFTYQLTYTVPNFVMEASGLLIVNLPWYRPFEPDAALSYQNRSHPIVNRNYIDTLAENISLSLPVGYTPLGVEPASTQESFAGRVTRSAASSTRALSISRTAVYTREVVPPAQYGEYKTYYNSVLRADRQAIVLAPEGTVLTRPTNRPAPQDSPAGGGQ